MGILGYLWINLGFNNKKMSWINYIINRNVILNGKLYII